MPSERVKKILEKSKFEDINEFRAWRRSNIDNGIPVWSLRDHVGLTKTEWSTLSRAARRLKTSRRA